MNTRRFWMNIALTLLVVLALIQPVSIQAAGLSQLPASEPPAPQPLADITVTMMSENFEGTFPPAGGLWTVLDADGAANGTYFWGADTTRFHGGTKSAWLARGGANGYSPSTNPTYPNNANSWMVYGPFSLADATTATLTFSFWNNSETSSNKNDMFYWLVSTNPQQLGYSGGGTSGNSQGWQTIPLDLSDYDGSGASVIGEPVVYIAFAFVSDGTTNSYEGAYVDDILLEKTVKPCYTLTMANVPNNGGGITRNPAPNCNNGTQYTEGTVVSLTATPSTGYSFTSWTGDVSGTNNSTSITMDAAHTVTANFALRCFTLSTSIAPAGSGTITPDVAPNCAGGTQYTYGTMVHLTAAPATGYTFSGWSGAASGATNPAMVTMTANQSITATFTQQCFTLTTAINPAGGGTLSGDVARNCNNGTQYTYGTVVHITAAPAAGYHFGGWSGDVTGSANPATVTMTANRTLTANFTQDVCYTLTTTASPAAGGAVTASPAPDCAGGTQYKDGTVVTLTAAPAADYVFSQFSGSVTGTTNPGTVTMSANRSVTATFTHQPQPVEYRIMIPCVMH